MPAQPDPSWGLVPDDLAQEWALLSDTLDQAIPAKQLDRNLIVASWNLREFGGLNPSWTTKPHDSPKRNRGDICLIAEIVSRFDVVAVQEVQANLTALRALMHCLGSDWAFHVTDVTAGAVAGHERLAFVYDLRRVRPSGLVGELVLSPEDLDTGPDGHPIDPHMAEQLVHTPYLMSFATSTLPFALTTVHVIWGDSDELEPRAREAKAVATMLGRAAAPVAHDESSDDFRASMILLGDFNLTSVGDVTYQALVEAGLHPDAESLSAPRGPTDRLGDHGKAGDKDNITYDQVAWFTHPTPGYLRFGRTGGGTFPWDEYMLVGEPGDTTYRISDHYPLWIEFSAREAA